MTEKPCQSPGRMKNSSYYIAPVGVQTHDLPHTVASNMGKVSYALTHSATAAVIQSYMQQEVLSLNKYRVYEIIPKVTHLSRSNNATGVCTNRFEK